MSDDVVSILDYEWGIFSDVLTRIGGTLTVGKVVRIVVDEDDSDVD